MDVAGWTALLLMAALVAWLVFRKGGSGTRRRSAVEDGARRATEARLRAKGVSDADDDPA